MAPFKVFLNVYDVTNTTSDSTNSFVTRLNNVTREIGFGGVFHGAVEIDGFEWSFGYCEKGTGVYCCHAKKNPMYTFREQLDLGITLTSRQQIRDIVTRLKGEWLGISYELLSRNCCHFCEAFCQELGCDTPPAWLNRLANGAEATLQFTNETIAAAKQVGSNLTKTALWLKDSVSRLIGQPADELNGEGSSSDSAALARHSPLAPTPSSHSFPVLGRQHALLVLGDKLAAGQQPDGSSSMPDFSRMGLVQHHSEGSSTNSSPIFTRQGYAGFGYDEGMHATASAPAACTDVYGSVGALHTANGMPSSTAHNFPDLLDLREDRVPAAGGAASGASSFLLGHLVEPSSSSSRRGEAPQQQHKLHVPPGGELAQHKAAEAGDPAAVVMPAAASPTPAAPARHTYVIPDLL